MKLILTHENADFDAVAAQLAAHKLEPAALPVLPRRLNDNVRRFITFYHSALPHIDPAALKRGPVESVVVVDTQSVLTVKGMHPDTPAYIIDHHPPGDDLPPHHTYTGDTVGATTTLLVEQIQEAGVKLTPIEATLLMLGIYEDTGSLLYGTTTPRDISAAAWLMMQGSDLDVVRRFLQHPLNEEQRALYDLLLQNAATYDFAGHAVVIATAEVPHNVDQISSVAHKLRELLEPSALFLLVKMGERLQLVARSTVDAIDVGAVADALGGGGHRRAAAAVIEDEALPVVFDRLKALLRRLVKPSATIAELMSKGIVQTVEVSAPVRRVAEQMRRSGHEGYPVVSDGRLVGLLTRHAVDRAMAHRMDDVPVSQVMESGHVVVRPSDSIHYLQRQMIDSGWGQIPVVDDAGDLIGIVTRTDLIKYWGQPEDTEARRFEIIRRMEAALSPGLMALVYAISEQAQEMALGLYCVGGFVRDLLLNRPNTDIDFVVEGDAIHLVRELVGRFGGAMRKHTQFGTATWIIDAETAAQFGYAEDLPETVDFVTSRTEFYANPSALPTVAQSSIKLDLHRRDFSINTLAIRLAPEPFGQLLDFWGGERDLQAGAIRVLHSISFVDDPTRILRAVRFEQRFGFHIEARTLGLIEPALPLLDRVSGPRLRHELELILREQRPERALRRLQALGVLDHLSPMIRVDAWLLAAFDGLRYVQQSPPWEEITLSPEKRNGWMRALYVLLTCRLGAAEAERLGRRLQVKRKTLDEVENGVRLFYDILPELWVWRQPSEVVQLLEDVSQTGLIVAWVIAPTYEARQQVVRYVTQWQHVRHTLPAEDLQAMGVKPGPAYGALLRRLRAAWLDGEIHTTVEEAQFVEKWVDEGLGGDG